MGTRRNSAAKPQRTLRRGYEASRLEEQLWELVFEQLWPITSRSTRRESQTAGSGGSLKTELERRARQARGA